MGRRSQWGEDLYRQVDQSFTVGLKVGEIMKIVHVAISRHWNFYLQILDFEGFFPCPLVFIPSSTYVVLLFKQLLSMFSGRGSGSEH